MRTTLDIADDVLYAAKDVARRDRTSVGQALTDLARAGLRSAVSSPARSRGGKAKPSPVDAKFRALGFDPLPKRGNKVVTAELVRKLMDQEGV